MIILISDDVGTSAGGQGTRDIVTEAIASDSVLYNLKIPGYNPASTIFAASMIPGLVNIRKVMDATGGELFDVQDVAQLERRLQRPDSADQDPLHAGVLHNGQWGRGQTAQTGCSPGAFVWEKGPRLHHPGQEQLLHSLKLVEDARETLCLLILRVAMRRSGKLIESPR